MNGLSNYTIRLGATVGGLIGVAVLWVLIGAITSVLVYRVILLVLTGGFVFNIVGFVTLILLDLLDAFLTEPYGGNDV